MSAARPRMESTPANLRKHFRALCSTIGERRAGTKGDRQAINYILRQFQHARLDKIWTEAFPCNSVQSARANVQIGKSRVFRKMEARVLAGSPGTEGRTFEADLVWIEMPEQAERLLTKSLQGKVALLFGPMPTRADLHQKLVQSRPAAVIHVDDRLPFEWVKDDGVYPVWAKLYGLPPTVTIPFASAWRLKKRGANRARVRVDVDLRSKTSANVVGELTGTRPGLESILVTAHHDTQCNNVGADDNASGVVALLELASIFARKRLPRTIRFISFGAEEQLSVGSSVYARKHAGELNKVGAVLNLDSVCSPLGHHWLLRAGTDDFGKWMTSRLRAAGFDVVEKTAPMPFADHFPFSAYGVPAATFMRPNMDNGMRWQHHSRFDDLDNISLAEQAKVIKAVSALVHQLCASPRLPFRRGVTPYQRAETARLAKELFDIQ